MEKKFWERGEKARVARAARMSPQQLNDILMGTRPCGLKRARRLEAATLLVLGEGRVVPATAWVRLADHAALVRKGVGA